MNPHIQNYYDQLAPKYDEDRFGNSYGQFIHQQELRVLQAFRAASPQGQVLDLACGTGRLLPWATHGVDISVAMLAQARSKYPDKDLRAGSALAIPADKDSFDQVYSFHLLMHLSAAELQAILAEVWRVLRPGGRFLFDIPSLKRRELTRYQADNWHGAQAASVAQIRDLAASQWQFIAYTGILFAPLHRLPLRLRPMALPLDNVLCRAPWREYASYLAFELQKP